MIKIIYFHKVIHYFFSDPIIYFSRNPRVPCKSGVLPGIDLSKWADFGQGTNNFHTTLEGFESLLLKK